jgi:hypothetical protein
MIMNRIKNSLQITFGVIGFLLNIVATILKFILMPFIVGYGYIVIALIKDAKERDDNFGKYNRDLALCKDVLGNVAGRYLFNHILIKKGGYPFGRMQETISSALGKNQRINKLTFLGKVICWILDVIDKDHCKKSINDTDCFESIDNIFRGNIR